MTDLSNEDLLARLRSGEDHFTERKPFKDQDGWLRTAVAFANSAPIDWPAILFVGVTDSGEIQENPPNLDQLQKNLSSQISRAYPPIYHLPKIVTDEQGRRCLAVLIPGSTDRPHFSGKSYVRVGSQSPEASEEQFSELIAQRQAKVYELLKWKNQLVTLEFWQTFVGAGARLRPSPGDTAVLDCTQFHLTFGALDNSWRESAPLSRVEISFDVKHGRIKIEVRSIAM